MINLRGAAWWEKLLLKFVPTHYGEDEFIQVWYKSLLGRVYIVRLEKKVRYPYVGGATKEERYN